MYLENVVFDALEPRLVGAFWEAAIGGERLTDEPAGFETRLAVEGGPVLDLCFQRVPERRIAPPRLQLVLAGVSGQPDGVDRLRALGARSLDLDEGSEVLVDPEGIPFRVQDPAAYADSGPLAALTLESADVDRDVQFWSWLTGWIAAGEGSRTLRHPSRRGPHLELRPESAPKSADKNRLHLDVRLEPGEDPDAVEAAIKDRGGDLLHTDWGELPWRSYTDPSGNEFCVLPAPREG
jgi:hypothetical protein